MQILKNDLIHSFSKIQVYPTLICSHVGAEKTQMKNCIGEKHY